MIVKRLHDGDYIPLGVSYLYYPHNGLAICVSWKNRHSLFSDDQRYIWMLFFEKEPHQWWPSSIRRKLQLTGL